MLRQQKVVYVSTPKVACTSLKLVIAQICGEQAVASHPEIIHNRRYWRSVPTLHDLSDQELDEIHTDNGWHVFAVVRHPTQRVWSAWQEKLLFRVPHLLAKAPENLVPPLPQTTDDIVASFQRFTAAMAAGECPRLMRDPHFRPQQAVLAARRMPYTRVYKISELDQVMAVLSERVRASGGGPVPPLPASNPTPLKPLRSMFTEGVLTAINEVYRADFKRWFRDADPMPSGTLVDDGYSPAQLREACDWAERGVPPARTDAPPLASA